MSFFIKQQTIKLVISIAMVLLSSAAFSQHYKLFNPASRKSFARFPEMDSTFGLKVDEATINGNDSVYHFNKGVSDEWVDAGDCIFWASTTCRPQNKPSPLGPKVEFNNISEWKFFTKSLETLEFHFNPNETTPVIFYADNMQYFTTTYQSTDIESVLEISDSVQSYRINHFDNNGVIINSPLNDHTIKIGKNLGLIQFFRIDHFPQVLQPVTLLGNKSPDAGMYQITNEMMYDFEPGDEIQYFDLRYFHQGGGGWNYERYIKHRVLEKQSTAEMVSYTIARDIFYIDSDLQEFDTINQSYNRHEVIAQIPFDDIINEYRLAKIDLTKTDFMGTGLWKYNIAEVYLDYCASGNCWGVGDYGGPPPNEVHTYLLGIGLFFYHWGSDYSSSGETYETSVVYFKKNDLTWGNEVFVGQNELATEDNYLKIYPNPARSSITIGKLSALEGQFRIYDVTGKLVKRDSVETDPVEISISDLKPGLYFLSYINRKGAQTGKFFKQ